MGVWHIEARDDVAGAWGVKGGLDSSANFQCHRIEVRPRSWVKVSPLIYFLDWYHEGVAVAQRFDGQKATQVSSR